MASSQPTSRFTLIAGPTASGKSALAMRLAQESSGLVVNADSMQVYRELRILTARPSEADEAAVPHRLYGMRVAASAYSVAAWLEDLRPLVEAAREGGPPLVIVGGTGLYFRGVLEGLSPVPAIPEEIRGFWRKEAIRLSAPALHAVLASRDPKLAARLAPTDPQRLARALEVLDATGRSLLDWQGIAGTPLIHDAEALRLYVCPSREVLYARCDARLDSMAASGALDEVERLAALGLDPALPAMRAVGMRPFLAFLQGKIGWDAALAFAKTETRQYAKRQLTWARRNMIAWNSVIAQ